MIPAPEHTRPCGGGRHCGVRASRIQSGRRHGWVLDRQRKIHSFGRLSFVPLRIFRAIATQRWRFPDRPAEDSNTWCLSCNMQWSEAVLHCIWQCQISQACWLWGAMVLAKAAGLQRTLVLQPAQVLVAAKIPLSWDTPHRLWQIPGQILRATPCWHICKDRNERFFTGGGANPEQVIRKAWHRIGVHVRIEWSTLLKEIRACKTSLPETRDRLVLLFGKEGV